MPTYTEEHEADVKPIIFYGTDPPVIPAQTLTFGATISGNFSVSTETIPAQTLSYNTSVA